MICLVERFTVILRILKIMYIYFMTIDIDFLYISFQFCSVVRCPSAFAVLVFVPDDEFLVFVKDHYIGSISVADLSSFQTVKLCSIF